MTDIKNVRHRFNLTGAKAGDWFLGCPSCWLQLPLNAAGPSTCKYCCKPLNIYTVRPEDVKEHKNDHRV